MSFHDVEFGFVLMFCLTALDNIFTGLPLIYQISIDHQVPSCAIKYKPEPVPKTVLSFSVLYNNWCCLSETVYLYLLISATT